MSTLWGFHQLLGNRQYMVLGTHLSWSSILVAHCSSHIFPQRHHPLQLGRSLKVHLDLGIFLWRKTNSKSFEEAAKASWESFINTQGYFNLAGENSTSYLKMEQQRSYWEEQRYRGVPLQGSGGLWGLTSHWTDGPDTGLGRALEKVQSSERDFVSSYEKTWFKI